MKRSLCLLFFITVLVQAKDIRIVTPYLGSITNKLEAEHMGELEDTALLGGVYFQWVNPAKYQWNVFLYGSKDINYSDIIGSHFIFDYYFNLPIIPIPGKCVIGAGYDFIQIKTDAGDTPGLAQFKMTNNVYAPYARIGRYFDFGTSLMKVSFLTWAGYEQDMIRGDMRVLLPMGFILEKEIESDYSYALAGLNAKVTLYHFIELSAKYYRKFNLEENDVRDVYSGMVNLYLSRKLGLGLSYRYKFMDVNVSTNSYHMGGIAVLF